MTISSEFIVEIQRGMTEILRELTDLIFHIVEKGKE